MTDPWRAEGEWLRCALHAHTSRSDGELAPRALARHYERAGYDAVAFTDHWRVTSARARGPIVTLPGVELGFARPDGRDGHLLALGIEAERDELQALAAARAGLAETAAWVERRGGLAFLAHPYWTGIAPGALELPGSVLGIEVYNASCELETGRGLAAVHWDELLAAGRLCPAIAVDDSHHPGFDSDHAWTWVRAEERSPAAVLAALARGSFYSSTGPLLHDVRADGRTVEVRCSPCRTVTLVSGPATGAAVNAGRLGYRHAGRELACDRDGLVVHARLEAPAAARHVRVEVTDAAGRRAWANPLPL
ncbi:MAG TPA: CehA/McbA family metallohydrolase [Gaiellaceae bacterium]|nr:CehA/McbA family metallohydrolase [Gaiellaceae bacterium]